MRVLIATGIYPPEIGGPATYTVRLEEGLPQYGIEVVALPYRAARKYWKIVRHLAYFILVLKASKRVDVIYAQDPVSVGLPACLASLVLRKPFILKMVGDYAWEQATQRSGYTGTLEEFQSARVGIFPTLLRTLERWVARKAVKVIVPSKYLGKIVEKWRVASTNIQVIYNGVEIPALGLKQVIRGLLRFDGRLVVSVGRLVPWKGFEALIRAHATLTAKFPNLKLLIVGSGPDQGKLEQLARDQGVAGSVVFTGALEHEVLLRYVRAADVFALNTSYEGFSHLILEVAAVGVPIVTTNVGGNPEFIEHGVNGFFVKPNDEHALAESIAALLTDVPLRAKIATNAKRKVEKFSVTHMVAETAELLQSL